MKMFTNLVITICFALLTNIFGSAVVLAHDTSHTKIHDQNTRTLNEGVDYCWEMTDYVLNYTATMRLGFNRVGEDHYLVGGIGTAKSTSGQFEITRTAHGSAEIIDGELVLSFTNAGIRNNIIGIDLTRARLNSVTFDGTFDHYGGFYDAVEISNGEMLSIKCPHDKSNRN